MRPRAWDGAQVACEASAGPASPGAAAASIASPRHPYTMALLSAVPEVGGTRRELVPIEGEPPSAVRIPSGCRFHPRCPVRVDRCLREPPELQELAPAHAAACHLASMGGARVATPPSWTTR